MLPSVDPVYSVAKGVVLPWLRWGLQWTIEGARPHPDVGPGDPREQPRLVSRSADARVVRRPARSPRALSRQGRAVRQAGARLVAARGAPDPGRRGSADAARRPRRRRRRAARAANASPCSPRARSRWTSSRWSASRGPRASRSRAGVPVTPVGLWGTHRILIKGRKPHWRGASRRPRWSASRSRLQPDEHVKDATDRMMARDLRVRRARPRDLPAATDSRATTRGGGADPTPRVLRSPADVA